MPQHDLGECVNALSTDALKGLLLDIATWQPSVALHLRSAYDQVLQQKRTRVISFDHYSKSIWHDLNGEYDHLSGSKQYEMAFEVTEEICNSIITIGKEAGNAENSFGTKRSGLETLRKIGKTICLSSNDTLGHEVQKHFQYETCLDDAIKAIVVTLNDVQCKAMCMINDGRSTFLQKMEELQGLAEGYCVFEHLGEVIDDLQGEDDEDEEEEEQDDEEEEDELDEEGVAGEEEEK